MTCGIDMAEISRIEKSLENPRFLTRNFGPDELAFFRALKNPAPSVAAGFCAKEAFSKAMGTGIRGFSLAEVQVLRDSLGKPYFVFTGQAAALVKESGLSFDVSLTHTKDYAAAVVIAF